MSLPECENCSQELAPSCKIIFDKSVECIMRATDVVLDSISRIEHQTAFLDLQKNYFESVTDIAQEGLKLMGCELSREQIAARIILAREVSYH